MIRNVTVVFLVALFLLPVSSVSGKWYCEDPSGVISGKTDPVKTCFYQGQGWNGEKPVGELYKAAITTFFRTFKCPCILNQPDQHDVQTWRALLNNLPRLYGKFPETNEAIRRGLMTSLTFLSEEARQKFSPLFTDTRDEELWTIMSETTSGSKQSIAKAFYQWCDNRAIIDEYVSFGHQPSLDEITADREHPKLKDFGGSISCLGAQSYIYEHLETLVAEGKPVTQPHAELLTSDRLNRLSNTVYARHGRIFKRADLQKWFSKQMWYKPDADYDPSAITATDRKNIKTIYTAKQQRH
jgi:hypothetical protein